MKIGSVFFDLYPEWDAEYAHSAIRRIFTAKVTEFPESIDYDREVFESLHPRNALEQEDLDLLKRLGYVRSTVEEADYNKGAAKKALDDQTERMSYLIDNPNTRPNHLEATIRRVVIFRRLPSPPTFSCLEGVFPSSYPPIVVAYGNVYTDTREFMVTTKRISDSEDEVENAPFFEDLVGRVGR